MEADERSEVLKNVQAVLSDMDKLRHKEEEVEEKLKEIEQNLHM
jgi:hypothetical protein